MTIHMQIGMLPERRDLERIIEKLTHMIVHGYTITPSSVIDVDSSILLLNGLPTKDEVIKRIVPSLNDSPKSRDYVEKLRSIDGNDACGYLAANGDLIPVKHLLALDKESCKRGTDILNMYPPPGIIPYLHSKLTDFWNREPNLIINRKFRESIESGEIKAGDQIDFLDVVYSPKNFERRLRDALTERYKQNLS